MKIQKVIVLIIGIALAVAATVIAQDAPAPEPAAETETAASVETAPTPSETATPTVPLTEEPVKEVPVAPVPEQEPKQMQVDPLELFARVKDVYAGDNAYEMEFTLSIEMPPKKKYPEDRIKQLENRYRVLYNNSNPADESYLLRLEGLEGINRRTIVVYDPSNVDAEYVVYKPKFPKGVKIKADNPKVEDVTDSTIQATIAEIEEYMNHSDSEINAYLNTVKNEYVLEILGPTTIGYNFKNNFPLLISTFRGSDLRIIQQDKFYKPKKEEDTILFRYRKTWPVYDTGVTPTPEQIKAVPDFNKE